MKEKLSFPLSCLNLVVNPVNPVNPDPSLSLSCPIFINIVFLNTTTKTRCQAKRTCWSCLLLYNDSNWNNEQIWQITWIQTRLQVKRWHRWKSQTHKNRSPRFGFAGTRVWITPLFCFWWVSFIAGLWTCRAPWHFWLASLSVQPQTVSRMFHTCFGTKWAWKVLTKQHHGILLALRFPG